MDKLAVDRVTELQADCLIIEQAPTLYKEDFGFRVYYEVELQPDGEEQVCSFDFERKDYTEIEWDAIEKAVQARQERFETVDPFESIKLPDASNVKDY